MNAFDVASPNEDAADVAIYDVRIAKLAGDPRPVLREAAVALQHRSADFGGICREGGDRAVNRTRLPSLA